jgi:hypothetical protein
MYKVIWEKHRKMEWERGKVKERKDKGKIKFKE